MKLKTDFCHEAREVLEEFLNSVVSTVAARSKVGQGLSIFCPAIEIGGGEHVPLQLFGLLLDGSLGKSWVKGSEMTTYRAE